LYLLSAPRSSLRHALSLPDLPIVSSGIGKGERSARGSEQSSDRIGELTTQEEDPRAGFYRQNSIYPQVCITNCTVSKFASIVPDCFSASKSSFVSFGVGVLPSRLFYTCVVQFVLHTSARHKSRQVFPLPDLPCVRNKVHPILSAAIFL